jgi:hypothetical protein
MSMKIGQFLQQLVPLSNQDIAEILEEQKLSRGLFGQIAITWGLCQPEHVWQAWSEQLTQFPGNVDIERAGVDTQALSLLPREIAEQFGVLPLRAMGGRMIVAASADTLDRASRHLPAMLGKQMQFVVADRKQIAHMIKMAYSIKTSPLRMRKPRPTRPLKVRRSA